MIIKKINKNIWFIKRKIYLYICSKEMNSNFIKFKGSIFAIIFGLVIASFVIINSKQNVFTYFYLLFTYAFTSWPINNWDNTLVWWTIYILAGLSLIISFYSGMFNIGIAGQMLASGSVTIIIGIRYDLSQPVAIICSLFSGILVSILVSLIIVLLKVFFNVHEVVTSILLNWTIWYLIKWIFKINKDLYDSNHGTSSIIHSGVNMNILGYDFILPLIIAVISIIIVWFLLKKTTLGYKIRTVGLNPFAAIYSGINNKIYYIISFVISGVFAGIMSVIYYITKNPSISFLNDDLPTIGFDSIAVALVGHMNPIGIVGSSFVWSLIKSGGSIGSVLSLPTAIGDIIFGIIIYASACSILLSNLQPIKFLIRYFNIFFNKEKRQITNNFIWNIYNYFIKNFKIIIKYNKINLDLMKNKNVKINQLNFKYKKEIKNNHFKFKKQKLIIFQQQINNINLKKNYFLNLIRIIIVKKNNKEYKNILREYKLKINNLKQNFYKEINKINNNVDFNLKLLNKNKKNEFCFNWGQFFNEIKFLNNYIYEQYNNIWKKGKIANWIIYQKKIKMIYDKNFNLYINEKMKFKNNIYNYKQNLIKKIFFLNKQKQKIKKIFLKKIKINIYQKNNNSKKKLINKLNLLKYLKIKILFFSKEFKNYKKEKNIKIININKNINILNNKIKEKIKLEKNNLNNKINNIFLNEKKSILKLK